MFKGKHIILGISGGIAAYKSVYLLRLLIKRGAEVQVIITPNGKEFITPVTLSSLSGRPVISEFFTANTGVWNSHVDLGLWADAMIIAPATASTIGKMSSGIADNMLLTTYFSARTKVFVAPAMDLDMYRHPATQRNLKQLIQDGIIVIEPTDGELASGLCGKGRMEEPEIIVEKLEEYFALHNSLKGKKILITAGPTHERIDPVRFIGNYSSGKMGYALASEAAARGAEVVLISGPVDLETPPYPDRIKRINVTSAQEMLNASVLEFPVCDAGIMCAAVADYAPESYSDSKIKRSCRDELTLHLVRNPDVAATLGASKGNRVLVGFALETDSGQDNAKAKIISKNLDWIVLNSLLDPDAGFRKDTNKITLFSANGEELSFPAKKKNEVAADILDVVFRK